MRNILSTLQEEFLPPLYLCPSFKHLSLITIIEQYKSGYEKIFTQTIYISQIYDASVEYKMEEDDLQHILRNYLYILPYPSQQQENAS